MCLNFEYSKQSKDVIHIHKNSLKLPIFFGCTMQLVGFNFPTRAQTCIPSMEVLTSPQRSPNHWTTREVPKVTNNF